MRFLGKHLLEKVRGPSPVRVWIPRGAARRPILFGRFELYGAAGETVQPGPISLVPHFGEVLAPIAVTKAVRIYGVRVVDADGCILRDVPMHVRPISAMSTDLINLTIQFGGCPPSGDTLRAIADQRLERRVLEHREGLRG